MNRTSTSHSQETQFADCRPTLLLVEGVVRLVIVQIIGNVIRAVTYYNITQRTQDTNCFNNGPASQTLTTLITIVSMCYLFATRLHPMLSQCWASVVDGGPPLTKHLLLVWLGQ